MQIKTRMAEQRPSVDITRTIPAGAAEILNLDALALVADLHRRFNGRRLELLAARVDRQQKLESGERPGFLERPLMFVLLIGASPRFRTTSSTGVSKSPVRWIGKWSSMR